MHYDDLVDLLVEKIKSLDYVKDFQQAETALMANQELFKAQEEMKALQKEAVKSFVGNWWIKSTDKKFWRRIGHVSLLMEMLEFLSVKI